MSRTTFRRAILILKSQGFDDFIEAMMIVRHALECSNGDPLEAMVLINMGPVNR